MAISYNKLWKLLVDKKMSKADLRKAAGIAPNTMTRLRRDEEVTLTVLNRICSTLEVDIGDIMEFLPKEGADITFDEGKLNIEYQMGTQDFDWDLKPDLPMEFIPGNVELIVRDRPRVEIEYIGGPIYVPPSANPNYEPPYIPPVFDQKG